MRSIVLVGSLLLVALAGADLILRAPDLSRGNASFALLPLALLMAVVGNYYASPRLRRLLNVAALGLFILVLALGDWTTDDTLDLPVPY